MSKKRKSSISFWRYLKQNYQIYTLLIPGIVCVFIFSYIPMYGAQIAFRDFSFRKGYWGSTWVGMKHFIRYVTAPNFWDLMWNTLSISLYSMLAEFPIPILLAFSINEVRSSRFKKTVQMVTYIPHFISTVAICSMITLFFNRSSGVVNHMINLLGYENIDFLGNPAYFRSIYVWSGVWQEAGWSTIIYLAALAGVDGQVVEAARIDGANRFQIIGHVYFPSIAPTICLLLVLRIGSLVGVGHEKILLLQNNLNLEVSEVISTYVYKLGLKDAQYSYTTAIGLFNTVVNVILLLTGNQIIKRISGNGLI